MGDSAGLGGWWSDRVGVIGRDRHHHVLGYKCPELLCEVPLHEGALYPKKTTTSKQILISTRDTASFDRIVGAEVSRGEG